jgi:hypothetical protein
VAKSYPKFLELDATPRREHPVRCHRDCNTFAERVKPRILVAAILLSAPILSCARGIVAIDLFALTRSAAALQTRVRSRADEDLHELTLDLNGHIVHFQIRMGLLGLGVILALAGLFATAVFLAAMAQRRAREAERAKRQLENASALRTRSSS